MIAVEKYIDLIDHTAERSLSVPRYLGTGYPPEIFGSEEHPIDTVKQHVERCRTQADDVLKRFPRFQDLLLHGILMVHDEPEKHFDVGDTVGPEKGSVGQHSLIGFQAEEQGASKLLTQKGYMLWVHFEKADQFFKTGRLFPPLTVRPEAFLAVIIDKNDNNNLFNKLLSTWLLSDKFDPRIIMPPNPALTFSFRQHDTFKQNLPLWTDNPGLMRVCETLLDENMQITENLWSQVPDDRIPQAVRLSLQSLC